MAAVRDNKARSRFELDVEGQTAFANYRLTPAAVVITHTDGANATSTATVIDPAKDATHADRGFSVTQPGDFLQPVVVAGNLVLVTETGTVLIYAP